MFLSGVTLILAYLSLLMLKSDFIVAVGKGACITLISCLAVNITFTPAVSHRSSFLSDVALTCSNIFDEPTWAISRVVIVISFTTEPAHDRVRRFRVAPRTLHLLCDLKLAYKSRLFDPVLFQMLLAFPCLFSKSCRCCCKSARGLARSASQRAAALTTPHYQIPSFEEPLLSPVPVLEMPNTQIQQGAHAYMHAYVY